MITSRVGSFDQYGSDDSGDEHDNIHKFTTEVNNIGNQVQ